MSTAIQQANDYAVAGTPYARPGLITADGERVELPTAVASPTVALVRRFVLFTARLQDFHIRFGDSSVVVDPADITAFSGGSTLDTTSSPKAPHIVLFAGQRARIRIPNGYTHFAHVSTVVGGFLHFVDATGDGTSGE